MSRVTPYITLGIALLTSTTAQAQCAMCKAVLESGGTREGAIVGRGVNDGILYLMGFPYLLMFGVAVYLFRDHLLKALGYRKATKTKSA